MKYQIKIPTPCSENWRKMTPTEKGAFCENCQKEVFDFTHKSKYELARLLDKNESLCGKFKPEQLNIPLPILKSNRPSKLGLILGMSTLVSLSNSVFSQEKIPDTVKIEKKYNVVQESKYTKKATDSVLIKGQVLESSTPLPCANIYLKEASYGTQTDFDGNFSLSISNETMETEPILIVSFIGFMTHEIKINKSTGFLNIEMTEGDFVLGMVVIQKQNIFRRIGNLFRKKNRENCE